MTSHIAITHRISESGRLAPAGSEGLALRSIPRRQSPAAGGVGGRTGQLSLFILNFAEERNTLTQTSESHFAILQQQLAKCKFRYSQYQTGTPGRFQKLQSSESQRRRAARTARYKLVHDLLHRRQSCVTRVRSRFLSSERKAAVDLSNPCGEKKNKTELKPKNVCIKMPFPASCE